MRFRFRLGNVYRVWLKGLRMDKEKNRIRSFHDLDVYQGSYQGSIKVLSQIVPKLPKEEQSDLAQQLRRSVKAIPRLIAEAYSKRHQKRGFRALIDDALEESNETIVSLSHAKDTYAIESELCIELIDLYDKTSRQLYNLSLAWENFKDRRLTKPKNANDT